MREDLTDTFRFLKQTGFDFIEVPINEPDYTNPASLTRWQQLGQQLAGLELNL